MIYIDLQNVSYFTSGFIDLLLRRTINQRSAVPDNVFNRSPTSAGFITTQTTLHRLFVELSEITEWYRLWILQRSSVSAGTFPSEPDPPSLQQGNQRRKRGPGCRPSRWPGSLPGWLSPSKVHESRGETAARESQLHVITTRPTWPAVRIAESYH